MSFSTNYKYFLVKKNILEYRDTYLSSYGSDLFIPNVIYYLHAVRRHRIFRYEIYFKHILNCSYFATQETNIINVIEFIMVAFLSSLVTYGICCVHVLVLLEKHILSWIIFKTTSKHVKVILTTEVEMDRNEGYHSRD